MIKVRIFVNKYVSCSRNTPKKVPANLKLLIATKMTQHDFLQPALIGLANLQIILDEKGGPSSDGQLFEQILGIQDTILQKFGLPISPDNEQLLWFKLVPTDNELSKRIDHLHTVATKYLLSNANKSAASKFNEDHSRQNKTRCMFCLNSK